MRCLGVYKRGIKGGAAETDGEEEKTVCDAHLVTRQVSSVQVTAWNATTADRHTCTFTSCIFFLFILLVTIEYSRKERNINFCITGCDAYILRSLECSG